MATANIWRVTDAGRAAIMDGNNLGINAVQFANLAIGTGSGAGGEADEGRTTLRAEVGREAVAGSTMVAGRVALEASFTPANATDVTEVGVIARVGQGAEFLAAYWTDGGRVVSRAGGSGDTIVLAGVIDLQAAEADVTVTLAPAITLPPPARTYLELLDTPAAYLASAFAQVDAAGAAQEFRTPAQVLSTLLGASASGSLLRTRVEDGMRRLEDVAPRAHAFSADGQLIAAPGPRFWLVAAAGAGGGGTAAWGNNVPLTSSQVAGAGGVSRVTGSGVLVEAAGGVEGARHAKGTPVAEAKSRAAVRRGSSSPGPAPGPAPAPYPSRSYSTTPITGASPRPERRPRRAGARSCDAESRRRLSDRGRIGWRRPTSAR